ncbi:MAG: hypothetical protein F4W68_03805 [Cenarchaeum sp. SB0661_bin_35]|nr:hypothetical protein [Cenarchaeum sp. SB0667_bin_13]MYB47113.1 hypothetical protein [Cenarchaeum sp. SB0662_bin_33]MYC79607.1 hypothetical protein [Cenarchaeum sp. SB0661_bin_35]MYD59081.1 hypothetical protein [Cenarchaeum sp. SB0678_bin_8]
MDRQLNLDSWQIVHISGLLNKGVSVYKRTNRPVEIYRKSLEESDGCYEEVICTIIDEYVLEQRVSSGGPIPPQFIYQAVCNIGDYPKILLKKNKDQFQSIVNALESLE